MFGVIERRPANLAAALEIRRNPKFGVETLSRNAGVHVSSGLASLGILQQTESAASPQTASVIAASNIQ